MGFNIVFVVATEAARNKASAVCGGNAIASQEFKSEVGGKEISNASQLPQVNNVTRNDDDFEDDQFYASLDLDVMETQATMLLKNKSEPPLEKQEINVQPNPDLQNGGVQALPSFDLGIW
ncbi:hypothetical protein V6N13_142353 [Hibiscus sabdariffa]|uniref:Uncharacterized protein n=1 Tax=Hibiscus sabdariffa TaxID=183260 RepID=A0ABR2FDY6_9ROSI